jgi:hypothetical protein
MNQYDLHPNIPTALAIIYRAISDVQHPIARDRHAIARLSEDRGIGLGSAYLGRGDYVVDVCSNPHLVAEMRQATLPVGDD